jgi:hypothetical protein
MSRIITCPTDCSASVPVVKFSECSPQVKEGQVATLFLANVGNPLTNWESLVEWNTRLSNTDAAADKIRALTVIGDVPLATGTEKTISHKRIIVTTKQRQLNFKIDDVSDINYDFMRALDCGGQFLMWYQTTAGDLYGGNSGILVTIPSIGEVISEATDTNTVIQGTAKWDAKISPMRIVSPLPVPFTITD